MGGNTSRLETVQTTVNKVLTDIINESISKTNQSVLGDQKVNLIGISNSKIEGINVIKKIKASLTGSKKSEISNDIANNMASTLKQKLDQELSGLNVALGENEQKAINQSVNNLTQTNIVSKSIEETTQVFDVSQTLNAIDVSNSTIKDITMQTTADLSATLASDLANRSGLTTAITNAMEQETKIKQENPLATVVASVGNAFKSLADGIAKILSVPADAAQNIIIIIVIGVAFVIYSFFSFGGVDTINKGVDIAASSQGFKTQPRPPLMMPPMGMPPMGMYPMGMPPMRPM